MPPQKTTATKKDGTRTGAVFLMYLVMLSCVLDSGLGAPVDHRAGFCENPVGLVFLFLVGLIGEFLVSSLGIFGFVEVHDRDVLYILIIVGLGAGQDGINVFAGQKFVSGGGVMLVSLTVV